MDNATGNISTIIKWISMLIAGWTIGTLAAHNLNLGIDAVTLSQVIAAVLFLGIGYIDAKYPNTFKFLDNAPIVPDPEEPVLNPEYECDINDQ